MKKESNQPLNKPILLALCALLLAAFFIGLGTWQVQRLSWKSALIERVNQRVHAPAIAPPAFSQWRAVSREQDEYRHVHVQGVFLESCSTEVAASTQLGQGFWLMTPLRTPSDAIIYINRGFIPSGSTACSVRQPNNIPINVTGILRLSEPNGAFLRNNNAAQSKWYSRDTAAMGANNKLSNVAPFFIDLNANKDNHPVLEKKREANCVEPVPGLTVIHFYNNHLVYALTWYAMACMVIISSLLFWRSKEI